MKLRHFSATHKWFFCPRRRSWLVAGASGAGDIARGARMPRVGRQGDDLGVRVGPRVLASAAVGGSEAQAHVLHPPVEPKGLLRGGDKAVACTELSRAFVDGVDHDQPSGGGLAGGDRPRPWDVLSTARRASRTMPTG